ncbi:MAG TPA: hypothetical protein VMU39_06420 [Solirubrobacteraceae bacterium]|nr:hypothetical protein [Solirubrobacteraceae bacterium]
MRRRVIVSSLVAAVLVSALVVASPAVSATDPVIAQCSATGAVSGNFTLQQLRHALNTLSPTTKEYTNCYDAINRAIAAKGGSGGGNGSSNSSGGSFLPTWLLIILIVLVLGAGAYGVVALRRQGQGGPPESGGPPDPSA